jgi:hypothetical protein
MTPYLDWPSPARDVVERACATYDGRRRWLTRRISAAPRILSGFLPALKGYGRTFFWPRRIVVEPAAGRLIFEGLPGPAKQGLYESGVVSLTDSQDNELEHQIDLRSSFRGTHKLTRWTQLDALYFFGYAITHYHSVPFTLGEARFIHHTRRRGLDVIGVELPVELHTHSRRQAFYFDDEGLIRRHDYVAEIVGGWARGAHLWRDYVRVDGFPVARERHVVARLGRVPTPFVALHAELDDVTVGPIGAPIGA